MKNCLTAILLIWYTCSVAQLGTPFRAKDQPAAPDYSDVKSWLSLPFRSDAADKIPKNSTWISDSLKPVDVFYIYPTVYLVGKTWCADIHDEKLNKSIDKLAVQTQVIAFNQEARIYTPKYRQAMIEAFANNTAAGEKALDFAYQDIKKAFEYYMKNYNQGRPIIIVSHSQGTRHARQLLKDYFDTPSMKEKLVCAYIVGFGVYPENYQVLKPCEQPEATNCFVTWASFKMGYSPSHAYDSLLFGHCCINPISWKRDTVVSSANTGILLNIDAKKPSFTMAKVIDNYLAVKSKLPFISMYKILHLVDFNLFWTSIQANVKLRIDEYMKAHPK